MMDSLTRLVIPFIDINNGRRIIGKFFDVHASAKAFAFGSYQDDFHIFAFSEGCNNLWDFIPHCAIKGINGRMIENDFGDIILNICFNRHLKPPPVSTAVQLERQLM